MKGTVAPPVARSRTAWAPSRRISGCRARNQESKAEGAGMVKTRLGREPYAAIIRRPGQRGGAPELALQAPPEVPGGDRPVRPPGLGRLLHPVRLGQDALPPGLLHRLADAEVVDGQHVQPAE